MGKYLLENIHAQYPQAKLAIVVASRSKMICDLFADYPWLEIIEVNRFSPRALFSLHKNFRSSDLVVTQYTGKSGGRFSFWSKFVARGLAKHGGLVGFVDASRWNKALYDVLLPVERNRAVVEHDREAVRAAHVPLALPFPVLHYKKDSTILSRFELSAEAFIVVHLFAGNAGRGLHPDKKKELIAKLTERFPGVRLVLTGAAADREEALRIAKDTSATMIAGDISLQELMNIIAVSKAVVSVDTGVAHIAAHLSKKLFVLRTCIAANWWFPEQYGPNAPIEVFSCDSVCADGHVFGGYPRCMNSIDITRLVASI